MIIIMIFDSFILSTESNFISIKEMKKKKNGFVKDYRST